MGILLPIEKMFFRFDRQRVIDDGRATMRGRSQTNDLRAKTNLPVVAVFGHMVEPDANGHQRVPPKENAAAGRKNTKTRRIFDMLLSSKGIAGPSGRAFRREAAGESACIPFISLYRVTHLRGNFVLQSGKQKDKLKGFERGSG